MLVTIPSKITNILPTFQNTETVTSPVPMYGCEMWYLILTDVLVHTLEECDNMLVEALCYKPEGRGFDSRCGHCISQST
jgi:hypothetical protein